MTNPEIIKLVGELAALPVETEWFEFKRNDHGAAKFEEIGEYLSAISNSLALLEREYGYLIWGIDNVTHQIVGTNFQFRTAKRGNEELENWLTYKLDPQIRFWIDEGDIAGKRVVVMTITPARDRPVSFDGVEYIRVGSLKKKLKSHPERESELWNKLRSFHDQDWSAGIINSAMLDDLDPAALQKARAEFKIKNPKLATQVDSWSDPAFLNKAKICINGKLTRTAILLLGRAESEHFLSPAVGKITWVLKDERGKEKDYEHFGPPFLLNVDKVFAKIRNLKYRYMRNNELFPTEITQFDSWVIREALHNCIAHQDYKLQGKISVVEQDDSLLFANLGFFIPQSIEAVIENDSPPAKYRNHFLAAAMVELNMIDTIGSGIRRMYQTQRDRYFPLPDYDLSDSSRVKVRITGKVIDENYTRILMSQTSLDLLEVIALDRVQKGYAITEVQYRSLKKKELIEGRRPNVFVSAVIAQLTDKKSEYISHRSLDKIHYKELVKEYLRKFQPAGKKDLEHLLIPKLPDVLTYDQKRNSVRNLLQEMRREGSIIPDRQRRGAKWLLAKKSREENN